MGNGNNVGLAIGHLMIPEIIAEIEKHYRVQKIGPGAYYHFYRKAEGSK